MFFATFYIIANIFQSLRIMAVVPMLFWEKQAWGRH